MSLLRDAAGKIHLIPTESTTVPNISPLLATKGPSPSLDDLDPYARAAIDALQNRNDKKKQEAQAAKEKAKAVKEEAKLNAKEASVAKAVEQKKARLEAAQEKAQAKSNAKEAKAAKKTKVPCKSRVKAPAPKKTKKKRVNSSAKEAVDKAKAANRDAIGVPRSKIFKAMPKLPSNGDNPPPVPYRAGVIYTSRKCRRFRALLTRGDKYSEVSVAWKQPKPTQGAWIETVRRMDAGK